MDEYHSLRSELLKHRFEHWTRLLSDMPAPQDASATSVGFLNSSSYLFATGNTRWLMDPAYARDGEADDESALLAEIIAQKVSFILISHLHSDHCQPSLAKQLAGTPVRWLVPSWIAEDFRRMTGIPEEEIIALPRDSTFSTQGIQITANDGFHHESGKPNTVPSASFDILLPDACRLAFPGDVRDFHQTPHAPENEYHYLFAHVFLGRDNCQGNVFPQLAAFCQFLLQWKASSIFLTHLGEIGRAPADMWTPRHASLVQQKLLELSPATKVLIPRHGETSLL